jgi:SulP family sulfate permease
MLSGAFSLPRLREDWFGNVRADILSALVVALALIPEAIAFALILGVDPKLGLYASFAIAMVSAIAGGRPGMISAATAATAVVLVTLVKDHGLQYLFAATILAGLLQLVAGWLRLGSLMRFVSRSVITGFVNALAILIFLAQLPELWPFSALTWALVALGLVVIYGLPRLTRAVPSPLVAIIVVTALTLGLGLDVRTVGDMGALPTDLPSFLFPDVPLTFETLSVIFPYAAAVAAVGLIESLLTATIVDDMTETPSDKNRECLGQGASNIVSGFLGGMAGCAMIGQSVINVRSGGRGRLSTFLAGLFLLVLVLGLGDWVSRIPMAALVAVMVMVSVGTFDWTSIKKLRTNPKSSSMVMLATVAVVLGTHDLAIGVLVGVLMSGIFFARKISQIFEVRSSLSPDGRTRTYEVHGQLFFASTEAFQRAIDFRDTATRVVFDLTHAHIWDISGIALLDKAVLRLRRGGADVEVIGANEASATLVDRLAIHDKVDAYDVLPGH